MKKLALYKCFNPRTHTGCDNPERVAVNNVRRVSIHAPTRGATVTITDYPTTNGEFQSTHPHGVRHRNCHSHLLRTSCFNPRTHTGCDKTQFEVVNGLVSFNPRTHTGCDLRQIAIKTFGRCFNPRTHTGCDAFPVFGR